MTRLLTLRNLLTGRGAAGTLAAAAAFIYLLNLNGGHSTRFDDSAQYIGQALNLAAGSAPCDTGYRLNPANPFIGPACYPAGFPLLLALVLKTAGPSLYAMKAACALFFAGFIYLLYLYLERRLKPASALAAAAAAAANPVFWNFRNYIYSDFPFMFFLLWAVYAAERLEENGPGARPAALLAACLGAALAAGTRAPGLLLAFAVPAAWLLRGRRPSLGALAAAASAAGAALLAGGGGGYLRIIAASLHAAGSAPAALAAGALRLWDNLALFFSYGPAGPWAAAAVLAFGAAGLPGLRRGPLTGPLFAAACLPLYLVINDAERYLFPLFPFMALLAFRGWEAFSARVPRAAAAAAAAGLLALTSAAYSFTFSYMAPFASGVLAQDADLCAPESAAAYAWLAGAVPPGGLIAALKPRAAALMTGRDAVGYHFSPDPRGLYAFFAGRGVTHVLAARFFEEDRLYLEPALAAAPGRFGKVFDNGAYAVYAAAGAGEAGACPRDLSTAIIPAGAQRRRHAELHICESR